jgi:hypothetical protein
MGMTVFSKTPPLKHEITVAKNYLKEDELARLNRMVSVFFDLAELRAMNHQPMYMKDWLAELDDFAKRYGQGVLENAGTVSHEVALAKAQAEYAKYRRKILNELSPAERDFLASIKAAQKKLEDNPRRKKSGGAV